MPRTRVGPSWKTEVTHEEPRGRTVVSESGATYTALVTQGGLLNTPVKSYVGGQ